MKNHAVYLLVHSPESLQRYPPSPHKSTSILESAPTNHFFCPPILTSTIRREGPRELWFIRIPPASVRPGDDDSRDESSPLRPQEHCLIYRLPLFVQARCKQAQEN